MLCRMTYLAQGDKIPRGQTFWAREHSDALAYARRWEADNPEGVLLTLKRIASKQSTFQPGIPRRRGTSGVQPRREVL